MCPSAVRSIAVPAVVGEFSGGVLSIEVETRPGTGIVYTATTPQIGVSTQTSEETAAGYALKSAGFAKNECDILYRVKGAGDSKFVDGPSAGAAMTLATIAALKNESIRSDIVVTGTIEPDGSIGPVGGLIEKGKAAADKGVLIMITPKPELYERMVLSSIRSASKNGISFVERDNISAAEGIAFAAEGTQVADEAGVELELRKPTANLTIIQVDGDTDLEKFREIGNALLRVSESDVAALRNDSADAKRFKGYFANEVSNNRQLLSEGYVFTAANNLFLMDVDIGFFGKGYLENIDLNDEAQNTANCLMSLRETEKLTDDYQWKVGADLREIWAKRKLNETLAKGANSAEEEYVAYREMLFADGWCRVSSLLDAQTGTGKAINESVWKGLAEKKLTDAKALMDTREEPDSDVDWHYGVANEAYDSGKYGAAVFDAVYAYTMTKADEEFQNLNSTDINETLNELSEKKMGTLWGKIYQGQGRFLYTSAGYDPKGSATAYRILRFSDALENATDEMDSEIMKGSSGEGGTVPVPNSGIDSEITPKLIVVFGASMLLLIVIGVYFAFIMRGGTNATRRKGKSTRRKRL